MPPALVSTPEDLVEYKVEDASEVEKNVKKGYLERHIHSEIYKRFVSNSSHPSLSVMHAYGIISSQMSTLLSTVIALKCYLIVSAEFHSWRLHTWPAS